MISSAPKAQLLNPDFFSFLLLFDRYRRKLTLVYTIINCSIIHYTIIELDALSHKMFKRFILLTRKRESDEKSKVSVFLMMR